MDIKGLKNHLEKHIGSGLMTIFDYGLDLAPYLGEINQTRKINRLNKRLNQHINQFQLIDKLFSSGKMSNEFIQERIGPIILSEIIEELEDAKIIYILNGFENVFINESTNESLIINYYDTLRNLRYEDIRMLYYYAAITDELPLETNLELIGLQKQIYSKLERLHLIKSARTWGAMQKGAEELTDEQRKVELTAYGLSFIKFISMEFDEVKYQTKIKKYAINSDDKVQPLQFNHF